MHRFHQAPRRTRSLARKGWRCPGLHKQSVRLVRKSKTVCVWRCRHQGPDMNPSPLLRTPSSLLSLLAVTLTSTKATPRGGTHPSGCLPCSKMLALGSHGRPHCSTYLPQATPDGEGQRERRGYQRNRCTMAFGFMKDLRFRCFQFSALRYHCRVCFEHFKAFKQGREMGFSCVKSSRPDTASVVGAASQDKIVSRMKTS